jgi:hypothetical protein
VIILDLCSDATSHAQDSETRELKIAFACKFVHKCLTVTPDENLHRRTIHLPDDALGQLHGLVPDVVDEVRRYGTRGGGDIGRYGVSCGC